MAEGVRRTVAGGRSGRRRHRDDRHRGTVSPDGQPVGTVHLAVATPLGSRVESRD
jgi:nicotinamide-nucleotide amidase